MYIKRIPIISNDALIANSLSINSQVGTKVQNCVG